MFAYMAYRDKNGYEHGDSRRDVLKKLRAHALEGVYLEVKLGERWMDVREAIPEIGSRSGVFCAECEKVYAPDQCTRKKVHHGAHTICPQGHVAEHVTKIGGWAASQIDRSTRGPGLRQRASERSRDADYAGSLAIGSPVRQTPSAPAPVQICPICGGEWGEDCDFHTDAEIAAASPRSRAQWDEMRTRWE